MGLTTNDCKYFFELNIDKHIDKFALVMYNNTHWRGSICSMKSRLNRYTAFLGVCAVIVSVYGVLFALGITCPIKYLLGISCPGCGMSRAVWALLRLDFAAAAYYHPLCFALPFVAAGLIYTYIRKQTRLFQILLWGFVGVMIVVYLGRLFFTESRVVVAVPQDGWIFRTARKVIHAILAPCSE